jgi:uncharacterized protein (TIGR02996 family)
VQRQLIERIAQHPNDDIAWRILTDVLLEAGDPRGEYLALSMKQRQSATHKKKLAKLFNRYRLPWLGPLASLVVPPFEDEVWEHGFPVKLTCYLDGTTVGAWQWLTVRELVLAGSESTAHLPLELQPSCTPNLRSVVAMPARWSSREGLVQAERWPAELERWLEANGRGHLLNVT